MSEEKPVRTIEEVSEELIKATGRLLEDSFASSEPGRMRQFSAIYAEIVLETLMRVSKFILKEEEEI